MTGKSIPIVIAAAARGAAVGLVVAVGIGAIPSVIACAFTWPSDGEAADRQRRLANAIADGFYNVFVAGLVTVPVGVIWSVRRSRRRAV